MARPRSDEKRQAILEAAAKAIAEDGLGASTSKIAKIARVADGSVFTYFATKDELLNQLYIETKLELGKTLMSGFPSQASSKEQIRHVWTALVNWGVSNPELNKATKQLKVSEKITAESKALIEHSYATLCDLLLEQISHGRMRDMPTAFGMAIMSTIAETTMEFIARDPDNAEKYRAAGFETFWSAIAPE